MIYLALINRHINAVETCVCSREHFHVFITVNSELTNITVITLEKKIKKIDKSFRSISFDRRIC